MKCRQQHGRLDVNLGGPEFLKRHSSEMLDQGLDFPPPSSPLAATLKQVLRVQPGEGDAAQGCETALLQYAPIQPWLAPPSRLLEIGILLPNNQRQHRTFYIQQDMLPYAFCWLLCPVPAALASIFRMDSISTSNSRLLC
jgi:hypothetical protein